MPSDRRFVIEPEGLPGMMLATLEALRHLGGSGSIQEIDETVIEMEGLSEVEQSIPMRNNAQRLKVDYYLSWARTNLGRGGAVENSAHGVLAITKGGSAIHDRALVAAIVETVQARSMIRPAGSARPRKRLQTRGTAPSSSSQKPMRGHPTSPAAGSSGEQFREDCR